MTTSDQSSSAVVEAKPILPRLRKVELPTEAERMAHLLHDRQGLNDTEIGLLMRCRRETANRYRAGFRRKVDAIRLQFPECAGTLLNALTTVN
jgi:hypothetical protein